MWERIIACIKILAVFIEILFLICLTFHCFYHFSTCFLKIRFDEKLDLENLEIIMSWLTVLNALHKSKNIAATTPL